MFNYQLILRHPPVLLLHAARNLTATMTPRYVFSTIAMVRATFVPISGKPKDNYLLSMRECLTPTLLGTPYNTADSYHNIWGILFTTHIWTAVYPTIPNDATSIVCSRYDTIHKYI